MYSRPSRPWPTYLLAALCVGAIVAAALVVGPASGSTASGGRVIAVGEGVVQSTVSGSGNVQADSQLNLGFKTTGAVTQIYVHQGQHVVAGQLLAELDPKSAEVALEQAKASLQSAEAGLVQEEETDGEGSGAASGTGAAGASHATAVKTKLSPALREANIASARAAVKSDRLAVQNAEQTLSDTKLYAPITGTIVSLAGEVGETVSATGTTRSSSSSSSSSSSGSGSGSSASGLGRSAAASGSGEGSGSGSGGSGTAFAVLSDLSSMQLVAALSESEVVSVRPGQPATVSVEALEGTKLAAHVGSVATLPTSSSGVVSYDVTFALDQLDSTIKPGMSATAEVVVKQAEGVNVPTSAITADTVTVVHDGVQTRRRIVTGLAGDSSTIVLSGLRAGEQIVLPVARATGGLSSVLSRLGGRTGTLGGAGGFAGAGAGGLGGGGGAAFFRGG
ncbi:MAG TPA: HlyD family efflux transporter periplasmic adaptor subunit [Solirubrobacteraceae bacterium]|jgi:macrolide-specific efflux system membrane fusion protein|nr:HlyD family efflux transporter periplasmic adaptor subunit [Solirubrobacteraceae bacterium]